MLTASYVDKYIGLGRIFARKNHFNAIFLKSDSIVLSSMKVNFYDYPFFCIKHNALMDVNFCGHCLNISKMLTHNTLTSLLKRLFL
jgi:hypothetical protein